MRCWRRVAFPGSRRRPSRSPSRPTPARRCIPSAATGLGLADLGDGPAGGQRGGGHRRPAHRDDAVPLHPCTHLGGDRRHLPAGAHPAARRDRRQSRGIATRRLPRPLPAGPDRDPRAAGHRLPGPDRRPGPTARSPPSTPTRCGRRRPAPVPSTSRTRLFALPVYLGLAFPLGRDIGCPYRWTAGGYAGARIDYFEVAPGGDPAWVVISLLRLRPARGGLRPGAVGRGVARPGRSTRGSEAGPKLGPPYSEHRPCVKNFAVGDSADALG